MSSDVTGTVLRHLETALHTDPQRASVTFVGLESIEVLRFVDGADVVYVTLGSSRYPMGDPTQILADTTAGPRAELVLRMAASAQLPGAHRTLATLAAAPSVEGLVLTDDALLDVGEPLWAGSSCTAVLLGEDTLEACGLDEPLEPVCFLRAVPITANEAAWVRLKGAAALRELWAEAGIDVADPNRGMPELR